MDMWVSYAKRRRSCILCTQSIVPGDRVMVGQWKRTGAYGTRTTRTMSHFDCWISKARTWLDDNPYEPPTGLNSENAPNAGRPRKYTIEQGKQRLTMQVQMRRMVKRQQYYNGQGLWLVAESYGAKAKVIREQLSSMLTCHNI